MRELKESEYVKDDKIWCSVCNTPKQMTIKGMLIECGCKCKQDAIKAERKKERDAIIKENHRKCYAELGSENLERYRRCLKNLEQNQFTDKAAGYVEHFEDYAVNGTGLLLVGDVGTGKSTLASAIANELLLQGYTVKFTNFSHIMDVYESKDNNVKKLNYLESLNRYHVLVIDDYGIERKSSAMQELIYKVINGRYEAKKPMIITTNKNPEPNNLDERRVFDRIISVCHRIKMDGESRRLAEAKAL